MGEKITQGKLMDALDWAYDKAVNGAILGTNTAEELARDYMKEGNGNCWKNANSLIRWQNTKAGTSGFVTGLGGVITMPVTIPANIASVLFIQIRMIAAIAIIGGYDVKNDKVKALCYACMCGNEAKDIIKNVGIVFGTKIAKSSLERMSAKVLVKINQAVGFRLVTKFGSTGVINLGKAIPLIGGIVGGSFDAVTTNIIGNIARKTFCTKNS